MKLKNLGTTVINIGKVVILPDETADIADKAYENNAAINHLVRTNRLELVVNESKNTTTPKNKKAEIEISSTESSSK